MSSLDQCAKKVVSDSQGPVDFVIGLVDSDSVFLRIQGFAVVYRHDHFSLSHRQKFRTRDTTRGYTWQPEDRSGRRGVQRFVWAFEKNGKYFFKTQRK